MLKEKFKKELDNLKNIINIRKINNIDYNLCYIVCKAHLEIDKNPKSKKNFTYENKIFIIKSVLKEFKNSKLVEHSNNYFLFELEEESTNANN